MAYTPKDWVTGEVITESALDHIEQGIANAGLVVLEVTKDGSTYTLSKSYNQIVAMLNAGAVPAIWDGNGDVKNLYVLSYTGTFLDSPFANFNPIGELSSADAVPVFMFGIPQDGTADDNMVFDESNS